MRLMTNNPMKYGGLEGFGLDIVERVPLTLHSNPENIDYLRTKRERLGPLHGGPRRRVDDDALTPPRCRRAPSTPRPRRVGTVLRRRARRAAARVAVVCAKFNGGITERLLDGALAGLEANGVKASTR